MPCKVIYTNDAGGVAWVNEAMQELRWHECLCLRCDNLLECEVADKLREQSMGWGLSMMITRCPKWKEKK